MEQTDIYDFIPKEQDPLYLIISKIPNGGTINLGEFEITLNKFGIYEIKTEDIHESKKSLEDCYKFINSTSKHKDIFY